MAGARPKVEAAVARQSGEERVRRLTERMLRKKLYVVLSSANRGSNLKPHLADHLEYMIGLEKRVCCSRRGRSRRPTAACRATA